MQNEIETDYTDDEEIREGILDSTLHSTLLEYKELDKMHKAILILAQVIAPEWCDMSVFMTAKKPGEEDDS